MIYFIRTTADCLPEHFQAPRTPDTVRRSLDGTRCILAFDDGTAPHGWTDGMTLTTLLEVINAAESRGVWNQTEND